MNGRHELQAQFLRLIAHPKRLALLELLDGGEKGVSELAAAMGVRPTNVSQELAPLRSAGIVGARRDGRSVYYRIACGRVPRACALLERAMLDTSARVLTASFAHGRRARRVRRSRGWAVAERVLAVDESG
jgi:ArsR family transcriptional regulator